MESDFCISTKTYSRYAIGARHNRSKADHKMKSLLISDSLLLVLTTPMMKRRLVEAMKRMRSPTTLSIECIIEPSTLGHGSCVKLKLLFLNSFFKNGKHSSKYLVWWFSIVQLLYLQLSNYISPISTI